MSCHLRLGFPICLFPSGFFAIQSRNSRCIFLQSPFTSYLSLICYLFGSLKFSRYRPGVAQRVGRGIALLFHDRGTRRGWVVSSTSRPHFTPGKDPVPILQEAGWAPGPVWTGGKSRPLWDSISDRPARSQSLYRLSYPAHLRVKYISQRDMKLIFISNVLEMFVGLSAVERRVEVGWRLRPSVRQWMYLSLLRVLTFPCTCNWRSWLRWSIERCLYSSDYAASLLDG